MLKILKILVIKLFEIRLIVDVCIYLRLKLRGGILLHLVGHRVLAFDTLSKNENLLYILWGHAISDKFFENLLETLSNYFIFISSIEYVKYIKSGDRLKNNYCCISFDDGYKDVYQTIFPIIKKRNIPITIFLGTSFLNQQSTFIWDLFVHSQAKELGDDILNNSANVKHCVNKISIFGEKIKYLSEFDQQCLINDLGLTANNYSTPPDRLYLNWEEVKYLSKDSLITIGSHGVEHLNLTLQTDSKCSFELFESKKEIERKLHISVSTFSYPFGIFNDRLIQIAKDSGYKCCYSTTKGDNNIFSLKRTSLNQKIAKIFIKAIFLY